MLSNILKYMKDLTKGTLIRPHVEREIVNELFCVTFNTMLHEISEALAFRLNVVVIQRGLG